jgi:hypothetical protein
MIIDSMFLFPTFELHCPNCGMFVAVQRGERSWSALPVIKVSHGVWSIDASLAYTTARPVSLKQKIQDKHRVGGL